MTSQDAKHLVLFKTVSFRPSPETLTVQQRLGSGLRQTDPVTCRGWVGSRGLGGSFLYCCLWKCPYAVGSHGSPEMLALLGGPLEQRRLPARWREAGHERSAGVGARGEGRQAAPRAPCATERDKTAPPAQAASPRGALSPAQLAALPQSPTTLPTHCPQNRRCPEIWLPRGEADTTPICPILALPSPGPQPRPRIRPRGDRRCQPPP